MSDRRVRPPRVRPAFSMWAWLTLTPYLLTALAGIDLAASPRELGLGLLAAVLVHAVLLVAFLAIGGLERLTGAVPWLRWTIVAVGLIGLAEGRPALLTLLQRWLGLDLVETVWPLRFLMNATILTAAVLLIHAVTEAIVRARAADGRLRLVLDALESEATRIASTGRAVSAAFQRELATEVLDALGGLLTSGLPPDGLAKELRWIGRSVVQRAAGQARHAGLEAALATDGSLAIPASAEVRHAGRRLPQTESGPAWAITATAIVLFLPPAIQTYGLLPGLLQLLIASVVSLVLTRVVQSVPLPTRRCSSSTVLAGLYLIVGAVYTWVLVSPLGWDLLPAYYLGYGTIGYAIVATIIAIIASSLRQVREHERRTATALAESERRRFEAQHALIAEAAIASQLLDLDVHGGILATSYRLEAGAGIEALDELIDRVESVLRGRATTPHDFVPHLRDGVRATIAAWSLALDLDSDVDEGALDWLAQHPGSTAIAHDALTEGLMNAVRYGRGPHVAARLCRVDGGVELVVRHEGRIGALDTDGLTLRDLADRAAAVELVEDDGVVEFRVRLQDDT